jgi:hypothetical protein
LKTSYVYKRQKVVIILSRLIDKEPRICYKHRTAFWTDKFRRYWREVFDSGKGRERAEETVKEKWILGIGSMRYFEFIRKREGIKPFKYVNFHPAMGDSNI